MSEERTQEAAKSAIRRSTAYQMVEDGLLPGVEQIDLEGDITEERYVQYLRSVGNAVTRRGIGQIEAVSSEHSPDDPGLNDPVVAEVANQRLEVGASWVSLGLRTLQQVGGTLSQETLNDGLRAGVFVRGPEEGVIEVNRVFFEGFDS